MSVGGIIGFWAGSSTDIIMNSANYGKIYGKDTYTYDGTGGIAGACHTASAKVYNTCNYAEISGGMRCGGIVGSYVRNNLFYLCKCI